MNVFGFTWRVLLMKKNGSFPPDTAAILNSVALNRCLLARPCIAANFDADVF